MKSAKRDRDLEFMFEMGTLRYLDRTWVQFLRQNVASVAEHIFRVIWIALVIAKHEKVTDTDRIVKMALVHDISESRTGDTHYISRQYVTQDEKLAITDVLHKTILKDEFLSLWKEYEERKTIESKIVKDADNLDVDLELHEQPLVDPELRKSWQPIRSKAVYNKLYTKTAKRFWRQIQSSNPHDWHRLGRNRFVAGDWSQPAVKKTRKK